MKHGEFSRNRGKTFIIRRQSEKQLLEDEIHFLKPLFIACERRRISGCRVIFRRRESRQPEIRLRSFVYCWHLMRETKCRAMALTAKAIVKDAKKSLREKYCPRHKLTDKKTNKSLNRISTFVKLSSNTKS